MNALLFPGQGSQLVGMGSEFYKNFKVVKDIFSQADDKLNFPLSKPNILRELSSRALWKLVSLAKS